LLGPRAFGFAYVCERQVVIANSWNHAFWLVSSPFCSRFYGELVGENDDIIEAFVRSVIY
jgi:hypothetical protein